MAGEKVAEKKSTDESLEATNITEENKDKVVEEEQVTTETDNIEDNSEEEKKEPDTRNAKEKFYDTIPVTYKQADIVAKAATIILVVLLVYLVITSDVWR